MLAKLRAGGKLALARTLTKLETAAGDPLTTALLDEAWAIPMGIVVGLTGPPGVGKSTLLSALVKGWRAAGRSVAVIAVDPSSRRSGGALLGDRTRLDLDPEDAGVFVRSMAARERLGGLADLCFPTMVLMRALFDLVVVETVGVGQSETEVADLADLVIFAVQPASGDSLQFMKAGIVEIPDIAVVTKADLGLPAQQAARDLSAALHLVRPEPGDAGPMPVLLVNAMNGQGMPELLSAVDSVARRRCDGREQRRRSQVLLWMRQALQAEVGRRGLAALDGRIDPRDAPFAALDRLLRS